jgi:hypothetical protein
VLPEAGRLRVGREEVVGDLARAVERERCRAAATQRLDRGLLHPRAAKRRHRVLAREQRPRREDGGQRARRGTGDHVDHDPLAARLAIERLDPDHERAHRPGLEGAERSLAGQHQGDAELGQTRTSRDILTPPNSVA